MPATREEREALDEAQAGMQGRFEHTRQLQKKSHGWSKSTLSVLSTDSVDGSENEETCRQLREPQVLSSRTCTRTRTAETSAVFLHVALGQNHGTKLREESEVGDQRDAPQAAQQHGPRRVGQPQALQPDEAEPLPQRSTDDSARGRSVQEVVHVQQDGVDVKREGVHQVAQKTTRQSACGQLVKEEALQREQTAGVTFQKQHSTKVSMQHSSQRKARNASRRRGGCRRCRFICRIRAGILRLGPPLPPGQESHVHPAGTEVVFEQKVEPVEAAPKKHNGSQVLKRRQRKREINNCSEKHKQAFREQGSPPLAQHPRDFLHSVGTRMRGCRAG